jgi:protein TonB
LPIPAGVADLRVKHLRMPRSRPARRRLGPAWVGSLGLHLLVIFILIAVRVATTVPPPPEEQSVAVEFEPDKNQTKGGPNPSEQTETPQGAESAHMRPTPNAQAQPDNRPEINIVPPEYRQMPPPPDEVDAEPVPLPEPQRRIARAPSPRRAQSSPFSHPMEFSYAPRDVQGASAGLRNSRSIDLSAGPVVRGGHLLDRVAHVVGQGGRADYLALLSEFIETHKYYPPEAARNGEDGSATVELTVRRDGKVEALNLVQSSGSEILDAAWMAVFRDNRLPPFPDELNKPRETFTLTLNYHLIYGEAPQ